MAFIDASAEVDSVIGHRVLDFISKKIDTRIGGVIRFH